MAVRGATAATICVLGLAACSATPKPPNLDQLYDNAASIETEARRPVISIPGTLGSRLVDRKTGVVMWGGAVGISVDPDVPENARLISLPIGHGDETLRELRDDVRTDGVLRVARASVLGIPLELDIYRGVIATLIAGGFDFRETREEEVEDRQVNLDSFEFPYDWRRDIVEAASDLDYFIKRKTAQVKIARQQVFGEDDEPVKFDLIAHSMGGLVARYYLMYGGADLPADGSLPEVTWDGARHVGRAVFIAPPNTGSVLSFENLVNGKTLGPFQPTYEPALLGTHVSTYELFPRDRHHRVRIKGSDRPVSLFDPELWDRYGWGLLNPEQDSVLQVLMPDEPTAEGRRKRAKAHLAKILRRAEQFQRAMDREVTIPDTLEQYLVVGGGFETPSNVEFNPETGRVDITKLEEGDGVVLRVSSLLDERQDGDYTLNLRSPLHFRSVLLLPEEHVDITKSPVFGDNLLFWLLEAPRSGAQLVRPGRLSVAGAPSTARAARSPPADK